jgi:polyhydroxybutyrate depolymerase
MRAWTIGALVFATLIGVAAWHTLYWGAELEPADFTYPGTPSKVSCAKAGSATADLPRLRIRAPRNYRADHAHGLLVVFSPAGFGPALTERFMGLTRRATAQGVIVAYVGSRPLSVELASRFVHVPQAVARNWCIDASRIAFTGHSDGGTLAQVVALQATPQGALQPRAVVSSGAGLLESDFGTLECPAVRDLDVLILHGRNDRQFPEYGASATRAWARCLGCAPDPVTDAADCEHHAGCRGALTFCQHDGRHWNWPDQFRQAAVDAAGPHEPPARHGERVGGGV